MEFVVNGEASETDEENGDSKIFGKPQVLATEVPGEESETESDEELYEKTYQSSYTTKAATLLEEVSQNNLLQRKLIANNMSIWRIVKNLPKNYVTPVSKLIVSSDQLQVRSQIVLQSVAQSLRSTHKNTKQLRQQVKHLNFVPEITIPSKSGDM